MSQRWWSPTRGTIEPDEVVKALLVPGTDATNDLGSYVLAAHRAGAAAVETVAKGAVPSEHGLVHAMASAREHFAPPMVDAIAAHLPASYAGLLTRDLLDEAERGALQLYRTAVSKGVAPPIAASRAGGVYGVPFREMGTYVQLATDPRANPAAVIDSADRAVLKYAESVARSETTTPVSKAAEDDWQEREHPRHSDGRFRTKGSGTAVKERVAAPPPALSMAARFRSMMGLGGQAAPRVDTAPKDRIEQQQQATAEPRQVRQVRRARKVRRAEQPQEQIALTQQSVKTQSVQTQKVVSQAISQIAAKLGLTPIALSPPKPKVKPAAPKLQEDQALAGMMAPLDNSPAMETVILADLTLHADSRHWNQMHPQIQQQSSEFADPTRRIFRIGHLMKGSSSPEVATTGASASALQSVEGQTLDRYADDYVQPEVRHVWGDELESALSGGGDHLFVMDRLTELLQQKKSELVDVERQDKDGSVRLVPDPVRQANTKIFQAYHPHGSDNYDIEGDIVGPEYSVVQFQTGAGVRGRTVIPMVDEFVLSGPIGTEDYGSESQRDRANFELDKNAVYEIYEPQGISDSFGWISGGRHMQMYDHEHDVVVRRWFIRPISEDEADEVIGGPGNVDKALVGSELARFNQMVRRDEDGKFTSQGRARASTAVLEREAPAQERQEVQEEQQAEQPAQRRQVRQVRQVRRVRRTSPVQPLQAAQPAATVARQQAMSTRGVQVQALSMGQALVLARAAAKPNQAKQAAPVAVFTDARSYLMLDPETVDQLMEAEDDLLAGLKDGESVPLRYSMTRRSLAEAGFSRPESLPTKISRFVLNAQDRSGRFTKMEKTLMLSSSEAEISDKDRVRLGAELHDLFAAKPDLQVVEVMRNRNSLELHSTPIIARTPIIIEMENELDLVNSKNLSITKIGTYRANDIELDIEHDLPTTLVDVAGTVRTEAHGVEGTVANPKLEVYRITNPTIERYRLDNEQG